MTIPADLLLCLESIAILNPTTRDLIEAAKDTSLDYIKESHSFAVNLIVPRRRLVILDERYLEVESLIQARYIKTNSEEVDEDVYEFESENEVVE